MKQQKGFIQTSNIFLNYKNKNLWTQGKFFVFPHVLWNHRMKIKEKKVTSIHEWMKLRLDPSIDGNKVKTIGISVQFSRNLSNTASNPSKFCTLLVALVEITCAGDVGLTRILQVQFHFNYSSKRSNHSNTPNMLWW